MNISKVVKLFAVTGLLLVSVVAFNKVANASEAGINDEVILGTPSNDGILLGNTNDGVVPNTVGDTNDGVVPNTVGDTNDRVELNAPAKNSDGHWLVSTPENDKVIVSAPAKNSDGAWLARTPGHDRVDLNAPDQNDGNTATRPSLGNTATTVAPSGFIPSGFIPSGFIPTGIIA
jgi:hypothetical protein